MTQSVENYALTQDGGHMADGMTLRYPDFLTDGQKCRLSHIRQMRLLFGSEEEIAHKLSAGHCQYYLIEGRSKFDFPYVRVNGSIRRMYLEYNLLGLMSLKTADLLFGQTPLFDCEDDTQKTALQAIARHSRLHSVLLNAAIEASHDGEAFLESMIHTDGQVYCRQVPSDEIFPLGDIQPDGQYARYVRYLAKNNGTREAPLWLLLQTTISAGKIERVCFQLDKDAQKKTATLAIAAWGDPSLEAVTLTRLDRPSVVWVPNLRGKAISDYACAIDSQDKVNAKNTQLARVLQKHADPKLAMPQSAADANGNVRADHDYIVVRPGESPAYITWNAELASALTDRDAAIKELLVRTEMSASLLGLKDGAAPDAYKKVRLESFNSLAKAARKAVDWTSAVQLLLDIALAMDNTRPNVSYPHGEASPVGVTLRDGIPIDDNEQAVTISTLRMAGVMSRRRAVQMQLGDESAVDAEIAELDAEASAAAPTVNLSGPLNEIPMDATTEGAS